MKAMMTTEYVCQLLENSFRKGQNTNNEDAVFGILSWVQNRLGDEGLIRLFEKMAKLEPFFRHFGGEFKPPFLCTSGV